ncbi:MAG: DUF5701 family protein [Candidatus Buchananbacteria bacterium]
MNRNELVEKAVKLLINVPPSEVDEVLAEIRQELVGKYKVYTAEELLVIANEQIERLRNRLTKLEESTEIEPQQANAILALLTTKRDEAIGKVANVPIISYHLPLLAAINMGNLNASIQMSMVVHGKKTGTNYLDDGKITDEVDLPKGVAWWAIDVEDGEQFLTDETSPQDEEAIIAEQGRLCAVATEAIALGVHTNVLSWHNIDALGSRFRDAGRVPSLCRNNSGWEMDWRGRGVASAKWGSASCRSRV